MSRVRHHNRSDGRKETDVILGCDRQIDYMITLTEYFDRNELHVDSAI